MERTLPSDTAGPHGIQETTVMERKLMEPSAHCFTPWPHGMVKTIEPQWKRTAQRLHWDTVGPHGIQEKIVIQGNSMEQMFNCDNAGPDQIKEITVMQWNQLEPRISCQHNRWLRLGSKRKEFRSQGMGVVQHIPQQSLKQHKAMSIKCPSLCRISVASPLFWIPELWSHPKQHPPQGSAW